MTTTLGIVCSTGIVLGTDSRATMGQMIIIIGKKNGR